MLALRDAWLGLHSNAKDLTDMRAPSLLVNPRQRYPNHRHCVTKPKECQDRTTGLMEPSYRAAIIDLEVEIFSEGTLAAPEGCRVYQEYQAPVAGNTL